MKKNTTNKSKYLKLISTTLACTLLLCTCFFNPIYAISNLYKDAASVLVSINLATGATFSGDYMTMINNTTPVVEYMYTSGDPYAVDFIDNLGTIYTTNSNGSRISLNSSQLDNAFHIFENIGSGNTAVNISGNNAIFGTTSALSLQGLFGTSTQTSKPSNVVEQKVTLSQLNESRLKLVGNNLDAYYNSLPTYQEGSDIYFYYPNTQYYVRINHSTNYNYYNYTINTASGITNKNLYQYQYASPGSGRYSFTPYNNNEIKIMPIINDNNLNVYFVQQYQDEYNNTSYMALKGKITYSYSGISYNGGYGPMQIPLSDLSTVTNTYVTSLEGFTTVSKPNLQQDQLMYIDLGNDIQQVIENNDVYYKIILENQQEIIDQNASILNKLDGFFDNFFGNLENTLTNWWNKLTNQSGSSINITDNVAYENTINNLIDDVNDANDNLDPNLQEQLGDHEQPIQTLATSTVIPFFNTLTSNNLDLLIYAPLVLAIVRLVI